MSRSALPVAILLLAALAGPAAAQSTREIQRDLGKTKNSWEQRALILKLDPADGAAFGLLTKGLQRRDWYLRLAAIDVLSKVRDADVLAKLEGLKDARALEAVAWAYGRSKQRARLPFLLKLLEHKKAPVRSAAATAIAWLPPDRRAVEGLIACWEKEKKKGFAVWIHCLESLERLTGERRGRQARDWRGWWKAVGDSFELPGAKKRPKTGGDRISTRARGTRIDLESRGRGLPLLVLPEYGYEHVYLQTWLRDLEDTNQVLYMKLPGAVDFTDPKLKPAPGLPDPYYPIERIVKSLDALHADLVKQKKIKNRPFALLAHGLTGWIAMTYASKFPKKVRKMLLVAPYSGGEAWEAGRVRTVAFGEKSGDIEAKHFAMNQLYDGYKTSGVDEDTALERKEFSLYFADRSRLEIARQWGDVITKRENGEEWEARRIARALGTVVIPEFELKTLPKVRVPTLIAHGDRSIRTSLADANVIAKHYGAAKVVRFPKSSRMPFLEEHDRFVKIARKFLRK